MFACMHVCLLVAYLLQKVWTDLANLFFLLAPSSSCMVLSQKILDLRSPFSKNPEKLILAGSYNFFLQISSK